MKKLITTVLILLASASAQAKTVKEVGVMSDYLFRGMTQTNHGAAGYIQLTEKVGNAYANISFINIEAGNDYEGFPVEMDVSFGYNSQFDSFNIDFEVITYNYLVDSIGDETEFKIGTSLSKSVDLAIYRGIKNKTWYPELSYEAFLGNRLYLDAAVGYWMPDNGDDNALTFRAELGRDFPEFYGIDIYVAVDFISDTTPFGYDTDNDDAETEVVFGLRKRF
jgi:uncharacterized protein (TIGR02001 family)